MDNNYCYQVTGFAGDSYVFYVFFSLFIKKLCEFYVLLIPQKHNNNYCKLLNSFG